MKPASFAERVVNTLAVITFQGMSVVELQQAFHDSVEVYLDWCKERDKEPEKPFSGKFVARLGQALHRRAYLAAKAKGAKSLDAWFSKLVDDATILIFLKQKKTATTAGAGCLFFL